MSGAVQGADPGAVLGAAVGFLLVLNVVVSNINLVSCRIPVAES